MKLRGTKRQMTGTVVSNKADKTVTVLVANPKGGG